jgi:hypothetical protein
MSESSEALTRVDVFFLGVFFFLAGALFLEVPPRVGRANLSSSACSFAAYKASASKLGFLFFLGGDPLTVSEISSLSALRLGGVAASGMEAGESWWPLVGKGGSGISTDATGAEGSLIRALKISNRSMISSLIAAYTTVSDLSLTQAYSRECATFCGVISYSTFSWMPARIFFSEILVRSLSARMASMMAM